MRKPFRNLLLLGCLIVIVIVFLSPHFFQRAAIISGTVDQNFIEKLAHQKDGSKVVLNSSGGDPDYAERALTTILEKDLIVDIGDLCASSCAEYLIPLGERVDTTESTIIAFHQSPRLIEFIKSRFSSTQSLPLCHYQDNLDYLEGLNVGVAANSEGWNETYERLGVVRAEILNNGACSQVMFELKHDLWLPTQSELFDYFNITTSTKVCADFPDKCSDRLSELLPFLDSAIIGDKVYEYHGGN